MRKISRKIFLIVFEKKSESKSRLSLNKKNKEKLKSSVNLK